MERASAFNIPVYRINPTTGQVIFINNKGCHLTCAAMILTATTDSYKNLYNLNDWLLKNNGYDTSNGPRWDIIKTYFNYKIVDFTSELPIIESHFDLKSKTTIIDRTKEQSLVMIDNALRDCSKMVVLTVSAYPDVYPPPFLEHHYVLATKGDQGNYKIYDPWFFQNEGDKPIQMDDVNKRYNIINFRIITVQK